MVYILPVEILLTEIENNSYLKRTLLNPHRGYVKIDAYLLQLLCNMTSDVKFLHMFFSYLHCCSEALFYEVKQH